MTSVVRINLSRVSFCHQKDFLSGLHFWLRPGKLMKKSDHATMLETTKGTENSRKYWK